jgi:antitoxin CptB
MQTDPRLKALAYRSHHRGTREADMMIGGFFDRYHGDWKATEIAWYEALMDEEDVDIMAWVIGAAPPPKRVQGPMMQAMQRLDYIDIAQ